MSIFGQLDAASIPTNPFFIEKGEYLAKVVNAKYQINKDEVRQLYIQYEIIDESSQYVGKKPSKTYNLPDEKMTQEDFLLLPGDDKKKIMQNISALKRDLCGNDANTSQRGLGVSVNDLNDPEWNPDSLKDTEVIIGITNYGAGNEGVNIRWVNLSE